MSSSCRDGDARDAGTSAAAPAGGSTRDSTTPCAALLQAAAGRRCSGTRPRQGLFPAKSICSIPKSVAHRPHRFRHDFEPPVPRAASRREWAGGLRRPARNNPAAPGHGFQGEGRRHRESWRWSAPCRGASRAAGGGSGERRRNSLNGMVRPPTITRQLSRPLRHHPAFRRCGHSRRGASEKSNQSHDSRRGNRFSPAPPAEMPVVFASRHSIAALLDGRTFPACVYDRIPRPRELLRSPRWQSGR